ncbi:MAG: hypothetical protein ACYTX0_44405 [Nostoc sp.]
MLHEHYLNLLDNITGDPVAGLDADELYDTRELVQQIQDMLTNKGEGNLSLGKAGTQEHLDAVMSAFRRSVWDEIQRIIHALDDCLLDISSGFEQEEEELQD